MKSLMRKLFGTRGRIQEGRRRPVRLGLEALEARVVPTTDGHWVGGVTGDPNNVDNANNWLNGTMPDEGTVDAGTAYFGDQTMLADPTMTHDHHWAVKTTSGFAGHTLTVSGSNLLEDRGAAYDNAPEHRYGTIKTTSGGRVGVATDMKWDGGDFAADASSGAGIYISATLQVCSVTGAGGTNPGALDEVNVYVGEDVYGNMASGSMKFGGSGANWLDSNVTVKNAAEILTEQKSDASKYGTLEFDNVGSATTKGGIVRSGSTLSVIANNGQLKRVGGDTSGNMEIDCQLYQPSSQGSAQLTSIGYNSGVYFKYGASGTFSGADFEGGACFVGSGATLKTDGSTTLTATNLVFTSPSYDGQTDAACSATLDAPNVNVHTGCNVFTGISSWTDTTHFTHMGFKETVYVKGNMQMIDDGTGGPKFVMSVSNAQSASGDNFNLNGTNNTMTMTSTSEITIGGYGTGQPQSGWQYTLFTYGSFSGADPGLIPGIAWSVESTGAGAFVVQAT
jgi:hypothetical protein